MLIFLKKKINKKIVICGDLNIAQNEDDVWSHKNLINVVSTQKLKQKN